MQWFVEIPARRFEVTADNAGDAIWLALQEYVQQNVPISAANRMPKGWDSDTVIGEEPAAITTPEDLVQWGAAHGCYRA